MKVKTPMDKFQDLHLNVSINYAMKKIYFLLFFALTTLLFSCEKQMRLGKINGEWDAVYYKIDGVEQNLDSLGGIFINFDNVYGGFVGKNPVPNSSGFLKAGFFEYTYFARKNRLLLFYDTGITEELIMKKIKALPPFLSYSDEETAKEEYMILTKGNEEFKFVKRWEE